MLSPLERRQSWNRIIGVERRSAPLHHLNGRPLPDPTRLEDEDFVEARIQMEQKKQNASTYVEAWDDPTRFD